MILDAFHIINNLGSISFGSVYRSFLNKVGASGAFVYFQNVINAILLVSQRRPAQYSCDIVRQLLLAPDSAG